MTDKEIIARQAEKIIELEDRLAEADEIKKHWFNQAQQHYSSSPEEHNLLADLMGAKA